MQSLKVICFNLALFFCLLILVEIGLRIGAPDYQYYYRTHHQQPNLHEVLAKTDSQWLKADTLLGWVCQQKSNLLFPTPPVEGVHYQINGAGFRNDFEFGDTLAKQQKRVLLLGDSFMFGIYLPEGETITSHLRRAKGAGYRFYNIAVPGWGLDQMYLAYQKYVDVVQPDQVVLAFVDDDLFRTMEILFHGCGRKPCFKIEKGQLVENRDAPHWWEHLCWNNQIGNRLLRIYYYRKTAKMGQFLIGALARQEIAAGRKLSLVRIPAWVDLEQEVPRELFDMSGLASEYAMPYVQLYDSLSKVPLETVSNYYIPDDGHPTKEGAALMARYILDCVE